MDEQVRRALDQLRPPEAVKAQAWEGVSRRLRRRRRPAPYSRCSSTGW